MIISNVSLNANCRVQSKHTGNAADSIPAPDRSGCQQTAPFDTFVTRGFPRLCGDHPGPRYHARKPARNVVRFDVLMQDGDDDPMNALMRQAPAVFDEGRSNGNLKLCRARRRKLRDETRGGNGASCLLVRHRPSHSGPPDLLLAFRRLFALQAGMDRPIRRWFSCAWRTGFPRSKISKSLRSGRHDDAAGLWLLVLKYGTKA